MTMKNFIIILIGLVFFSCEDNQILPEYEKKGTATATVATITPSNASPLAGETITITVEYINPASDPVKSISISAKVGAGAYEVIQTLDESTAAVDVMNTREFAYTAPAAGTVVSFEMKISSQKEYPQIKRTSITAK